MVCQKAFTSTEASCVPMHACAPAPKGVKRPGLILSSALALEKRSGSNRSGAVHQVASRWAEPIMARTIVPAGIR